MLRGFSHPRLLFYSERFNREIVMSKYYVYLHRTLCGKVFYVGKGTGYRVKERGHRSKAWHLFANKGYTYQIVKDSISEAEALELEEKLISIYKSSVVNKITNSKIKPLDFSFFDKYFYYSEDSPSGLCWKIPVGNKIKAGNFAGSKRKSGWQIAVEGRDYLAHRVVWLLFNKDVCQNKVIDHVNGDPWDNRISNLKPKSKANNARNRKYKNKSHETIGVVREVYKTGQEYFSAVWTDLSGKARRKKFPIATLGENDAYRLAKEYRIKMIQDLNTQGAEYTDRHIHQ